MLSNEGFIFSLFYFLLNNFPIDEHQIHDDIIDNFYLNEVRQEKI